MRPCAVCGKGVKSNSLQSRGSGGWVINAFVWKVCKRGQVIREDINIQESMDLRIGVYLDRVGRFCFLGDKLSGGVEKRIHHQ